MGYTDQRMVVRPVVLDVPGLFNVVDPVTHQEYRDLTIGQVESLAREKGWELRGPDVQF